MGQDPTGAHASTFQFQLTAPKSSAKAGSNPAAVLGNFLSVYVTVMVQAEPGKVLTESEASPPGRVGELTICTAALSATFGPGCRGVMADGAVALTDVVVTVIGVELPPVINTYTTPPQSSKTNSTKADFSTVRTGRGSQPVRSWATVFLRRAGVALALGRLVSGFGATGTSTSGVAASASGSFVRLVLFLGRTFTVAPFALVA
jgi:hypothetical protein